VEGLERASLSPDFQVSWANTRVWTKNWFLHFF
jgi:hypothetical protein